MAAVVLAAAIGFPTLVEGAHEFAIASPADASVIAAQPDSHNASAPATVDVQLQYVLRGYAAEQICLRLLRSALHYYRGPIFTRDMHAMRQYAAGCFLATQPVKLQALPAGSYALVAEAKSSATAAVLNCSVFFAVVPPVGTATRPPEEFVPSYDWQPVLEDQHVPSGLEVQLPLDGSHQRKARIPSTWRLQVYMDHSLGFLRTDLHRTTRLQHVIAAAEAQAALRHTSASSALDCYALYAGPEWLDPAQTVESAQLFSRRGELQLRRQPCPSKGAALSSTAEHVRPDAAGAGEHDAGMQLAVVPDPL